MEFIELHHSASVHVPLALAVLFPVMQILIVILIARGFVPVKFWLLQWGLAGVQVMASMLAYLTGRRDRLFSAGGAELLNQHQELANSFLLAWAMIFLILPFAFVMGRSRWSILSHALLLLLMAAQLYMAIRLGQAGGRLVFGS